MKKNNINKELKDIKKYLPVNDEYLRELHNSLSNHQLFKRTDKKRTYGGAIKFAAVIACSLTILLASIFAVPRLEINRSRMPDNSGIIDPSDVDSNPSGVSEDIQYPGESLLLVCADNKFGFMNLSGKTIIKPQFDFASDFNEHGVATVMNYENGQENYGLLGLNGLLTDINLWEIGSFHEGIAKAKSKDGKYGFINTSGEWIIQPIYDDVEDFSEGMAAVGFAEPEKWGFVDATGKVVVEPHYQNVKGFSNGLAFVEEQGSWQTADIHYINKDGQEVITLPWEWVHASSFAADGTAIISKVSEDDRSVSQAGVIDKEGNLILPFSYTYISEAVDGLRIAAPSSKSGITYSGIIDAKGNWVVEPKYFEVGKINNGLFTASVIKGSRQHTGILKVDGTWLYEPTHYGVFSFKDNMVVFIENTGYDGVGAIMSLYDLEGNQLLNNQKFNYIEILSKDYIRCGTDIDTGKGIKAWSIYMPDGTELMPGTNMRTAHPLPDGNILSTVLEDDEFYIGLVNPETEEWIIEPRYYSVIRYYDGVGAGIRKIKDKCTDDTIVFVMEIFDNQGNIRYTSKEETMSMDDFQTKWLVLN